MNDSLIVAEHFLRPYFGERDLSCISQHIRPNRPATAVERLEEIRRLCGDSLYAEVEALSQLDLQLLAAAEEEFGRRLQYIPDVEQRRQDLQARCDALLRQLRVA